MMWCDGVCVESGLPTRRGTIVKQQLLDMPLVCTQTNYPMFIRSHPSTCVCAFFPMRVTYISCFLVNLSHDTPLSLHRSLCRPIRCFQGPEHYFVELALWPSYLQVLQTDTGATFFPINQSVSQSAILFKECFSLHHLLFLIRLTFEFYCIKIN